jgi:hypothetical protein
MTIYVPGIAVCAFFSLYIFYEYNRVQKAKREERREYLNERRQELLDNVIKPKKGKSDE